MRLVSETLHAAAWNEKGPYRSTTVKKLMLHPGRVLGVDRHAYVSRASHRTIHVVRIAFEGGDFVEVRSVMRAELDPIVDEFEKRKAAQEAAP